MKNTRRYTPHYSVPVNRDRYEDLRREYVRGLNAYKQRIERYRDRVEKLRENERENEE